MVSSFCSSKWNTIVPNLNSCLILSTYKYLHDTKTWRIKAEDLDICWGETARLGQEKHIGLGKLLRIHDVSHSCVFFTQTSFVGETCWKTESRKHACYNIIQGNLFYTQILQTLLIRCKSNDIKIIVFFHINVHKRFIIIKLICSKHRLKFSFVCFNSFSFLSFSMIFFRKKS